MQAQKLNIRIIIKIIGIILIIEGLFMLSCLPVSWYFKSTDFRALLISGIITLVPGIIIILFTQNINQKEASKKDGYLIVVLTWLTMSIFGTLPFLLSGSIINFTDAFFETISGFSTTGASILTNIEVIPKGVLFWRSLTQWIGGMGIIVFTVALLPLFGFGGMNLLQAEAPGITKDKIHPRVAATARRLWSIYFTFTILEIILLMLGDMNWYEAGCHAFTTMSTGGFSPKNSCIADYSPYIQYIIIIFMICGSTSFPLVYFFIKRQFIKVFKNEEFLFYISVIILSSLFIAIGLYTYSNLDIEKSIRNALFQVTSIISTTGFVNTDYMQWPSFLWFFLFLQDDIQKSNH
mgnify:FL=1